MRYFDRLLTSACWIMGMGMFSGFIPIPFEITTPLGQRWMWFAFFMSHVCLSRTWGLKERIKILESARTPARNDRK